MRYIWDPAKAALNYAKHGVSFGDAITAFDDPLGRYIQDRGHPERGNLIGHDATKKLLFVVHVELLAESPPATRIISARRAEKFRARDLPSTVHASWGARAKTATVPERASIDPTPSTQETQASP